MCGVLGAGPLGAEGVLGDGRGGVATIYVNSLADHEVRIVAREEDRGADQILRVSEAAERDATTTFRGLLFAIGHAFHPAVGQRIHVHTVVAQSLTERPRHGVDTGSGRAPGYGFAGAKAAHDG